MHTATTAPFAHRRSVILTATICTASLLISVFAASRPAKAAVVGNVYVAVTPCRLVDSRDPATIWLTPTTLRVKVASKCGVLAEATAAALTMTVTQTTGEGFLSAIPTGTAQQDVSILNFQAGQTRANGATVQLSASGVIDVFASVPTQIIVDVSGYFRPAIAGQASAGRFIAVAPARMLDTRTTAPVTARSTITVPLPQFVPSDASALAITITATDTQGEGYITAFQPGAVLPNASVLNFDRANQIRAAGFIASVSAAGINLYSSVRANIIVDITGYFTGSSAPTNADGLFVPVTPRRVLDTRTGQPVQAASSVTVGLATIASAPMAAIAANWTLTQTTGVGYVSAYSPGTAIPDTSTVNSDAAGQTIANLGFVKVSGGSVAAYSSATTHLLVDVFGWFMQSGQDSTVVAAVGDMVCPPTGAVTVFTCRQAAVSNRIIADSPLSMLLTLGDLQYDNGELAYFQTAYESSYGRLKNITKPAPGNHEYNTAGAPGYYGYFGAAAGDPTANNPTRGYYSFNVGSTWHVVSMNSNCSIVSCSVGSAQEQWLRNDLNASTRPCLLAFWHHPRFSSGAGHGDNTSVTPLWNALYDKGADLVLNGHEHDYERFAPQRGDATASPSGIREFVVGTGGKSLTPFNAARPSSEVRIPLTFGYLRLTLSPSSYSWQFITELGIVADAGEANCH